MKKMTSQEYYNSNRVGNDHMVLKFTIFFILCIPAFFSWIFAGIAIIYLGLILE